MAKKPIPENINIPEDLSTLTDAELAALHEDAVAAFTALMPEEGVAPTDETLDTLSTLADGVETLKAEMGSRAQSASLRSDAAAELADKVLGLQDLAQQASDEEAQEQQDDSEDAADGGADEADEGESMVAAGKRSRSFNINLSGFAKDDADAIVESQPKARVFAGAGAAGFNVGDEMTVLDMAKSINKRLSGFNASTYQLAAERGQHLSERFSVATLRRDFPADMVVQQEDPKAAMEAAVNEKNLPGGSLVASGGWCAPSETLYDLCNLSESANLVSLPEIQVNRGGIRFTPGPDYTTVYNSTGFCYTEAQDQIADYAKTGVANSGTKPCFHVPCPPFSEQRLGYCGICISAGLLQQRGYPEAIADFIEKALNGHHHRVSAAVINSMVAQSTAVTLNGPQAGATAPLLTAIDLQAMHYRAINRMNDTATLEVVLPTWIKAVIRSDLARRLGVDLIDVPDSRIAAWFSQRNVNPQYVVDWQDIATTAASGFICAPSGVSFLLYAAGTFVKGVTDSILLENIYDSANLGKNDYTALFTEDPYLVAKRCTDARVVTVPITPDGATRVGVQIDGCGVKIAG